MMNRHRNYLQSRFPRPVGTISGPQVLSFFFSVTKKVAIASMLSIALFCIAAKANGPLPEITVKLSIDSIQISGGEKNKAKLSVQRNGNTQSLTFKLDSSNRELVQFTTHEITLQPDQTTASLEITSTPTPIKTTVTLRALLQPADQLSAEQTLELVPARLNGITLSSPSMFGIENAKITCTVRLMAPAPAGGIEIYLSRLVVAELSERGLRLNTPNPRVDAGARSVSFGIEYEAIQNEYGDIYHFSSQTSYNAAARSNDLYIGVEPPDGGKPVAVPTFIQKTTFTVMPHLVASISVQPNSISGGSEAVATFTLNTAPLGSNEVARIWPKTPTSSNKTFARLLGSSCSATASSSEPIELPLSQGVSTYSFKVCSAPTSATTGSSVTVQLRSGLYSAPVTVSP
jgi:hypothetical protein